MASVREQLITALCEVLAGAGGGNVGVRRSLTETLRPNVTLPAFVVLPQTEQITPAEHEAQQRVLIVRVIVVVGDPNTDGGAIDQIADELLVWVEKKVMEDPTFGGLANEATVTSIAWSIEAGDQDYLGADMAVQITYFTQRGDPTASAA